MCLATTRLSIGEDSPIVALDNRFYKREGCLVEHLPLGALGTIDTVECKYLWLRGFVFLQNYLVLGSVHLYDSFAAFAGF